MDFIDYYKTLGVDKNATQDDVRTAYRKLARKHHPDLNPNDKGANKKFQQINEANEVLSDPEKRKKYDQYGKDWQHAEAFEKAKQSGGGRSRGGGNPEGGGERNSGGGFGGGGFSSGDFGGFGGGGEEFGEGGFSAFFESMFGRSAGAGSGNAKFRGQDQQAELQIALTDAARTHQQTFGINGKNIRITIPAGIENGHVIKLKGHGSPGTNGGPAGDLFIRFSISEDPRWRRDGSDLHVKQTLDLYTAVLGGETMVDTLDGKVKLKLNPGTQNGSVMRLKGKGFPVYKSEGKTGDLYVSLDIKIPATLTEKEKGLFTELAALAKK